MMPSDCSTIFLDTNCGENSGTNEEMGCDYILMEEGDPAAVVGTTTRASTTNKSNQEPQILVEVEAPATLAGGYVFWATTTSHSKNGNETTSHSQSIAFPVRVPTGGVSAGETIRAPLLAHRLEEHSSFDAGDNDDNNSDKSNDEDSNTRNDKSPGDHSTPVDTAISNGEWRAGLCSCFDMGIYHRDLWNAILCPQILLGKILMRTKLTWLAQPDNCHGRKQESSSSSCLRWTFRVLLCLVVAANFCAIQYWQQQDLDVFSKRTIEVVWWQELVSFVLSLPMSIWALVVVVRLRRAIRERYQIPPAKHCNVSLGNAEDVVCALCCSCCTLSQMASQTADLEGNSEGTNSTSYCNNSCTTKLCVGGTTESSGDSSCNEEVPSKQQHQQELQIKDENISNTTSSSSEKSFGWFQLRSQKNLHDSIHESPPLLATPPSPCHSMVSTNSHHLRHRLPSSPSSATSKSSTKRHLIVKE